MNVAEVKQVDESLKSTSIVNSTSQAEDPNANFTDEEVYAMKVEHFSTNMDKLVDALDNECTLPTLSLPMTEQQGCALLYYSKIPNRYNKTPSSDYESHFESLKIALNQLIKQVRGDEIGCFVKLSCRSPKDLTFTSPKVIDIYHKLIQEKFEKDPNLPKNEINFKICTLYESSLQFMKVKSAEEAFDLFLSSKRITFDVNLDLRFPSEFSTHVIVRPWKSIPLYAEFRGFVTNKKLNALSQYYTHCYFEELDKNHQQYRDRILEFFYAKISEKIPLSQYVIDFIVTDTEVLVLELNPFNISTGASLFSWELDEDRLSKGPFEFRYRKVVPVYKGIQNQLSPLWRQIIEK